MDDFSLRHEAVAGVGNDGIAAGGFAGQGRNVWNDQASYCDVEYNHFAGVWDELINTDAVEYGGSGVGNYGAVTAIDEQWGGRPASAELTLPPLAGLWLKLRK